MDEQTRMHLLKTMVRIRLAELQLAIMYKNGKVFCAAKASSPSYRGAAQKTLPFLYMIAS